MDRLTPLDAAFLLLEDADAHAALHIGSVGLFEGPPPGHDAVLRLVAAKLPRMPRFRQVVRPVPLDLGPPVWVDHDEFDLAYHVRRTALPAPGTEDQLRRLVGRLMSPRLDRDKPLWEMWVVEGLQDGRWAMVLKVHHCLADGLSGTAVLVSLLDPRRDTPLPAAGPWQPGPPPGPARLVGQALAHQVAAPARALTAATRMRPCSVGPVARGIARLAGDLPPRLSPVAGRMGAHRRIRWVRTSLTDIEAVRRAQGATVNDVALAVVTAGLRALLQGRGDALHPREVRALVPVSTRVGAASDQPGNRVSALLVDLPVHLADPVARLRALQAAVTARRQAGEAVAGAALTEAARLLPYPVLATALRLGFWLPQRTISTVVTNVPGPRTPLFLVGRRMLEAFPYVPIADAVRLGVAVFSYGGSLTFGVTADAATTPDVEVLVLGMDRGLAELVDLSQPRTTPAGAAKPPLPRT